MAVPLVLALITVPFVVMRAAMMELDCFVGRKKALDAEFARAAPGHRRAESRAQRRAAREARDSWEVKSRLYLTLCCSVLGMCMFTVLVVVAIAFFVMQLH